MTGTGRMRWAMKKDESHKGRGRKPKIGVLQYQVRNNDGDLVWVDVPKVDVDNE